MKVTEQIKSAKCEYEENGHCTLNECMYGDFLDRDDSRFDTGKYCFCDDVSKYINQHLSENEEQEKNNG